MELETGEDEYSIQEDGSLLLTGMPIYICQKMLVKRKITREIKNIYKVLHYSTRISNRLFLLCL